MDSPWRWEDETERKALIVAFILAVGLLASSAPCQTLTTNPPSAATTSAPPGVESEKTWSFSVSAYTFIVPDDRDFVQGTFTTDRKWLHLEARYNYEDLETGSVWMGYNFSVGDKLTFEITPMLGGVFGNTDGIAPGYKSSLSWKSLELYSEGEYVFDSNDSADDFFYTWSELTLAPVDWLRFGLVVQRTKLYETEFDIQRGLLVGLSYKGADFSGYVFYPDESGSTVVLAVALSF